MNNNRLEEKRNGGKKKELLYYIKNQAIRVETNKLNYIIGNPPFVGTKYQAIRVVIFH